MPLETISSYSEVDTRLPEHLTQHVETVAALQAQAESGLSIHQRTIEKVTVNLGRPLFLNLVIAFVTVWVVINLYPHALHLRSFDPPPFIYLQALVTLGGLLLAILILITQNRQAKLSERRAQLDLQINLLAEQKIAKLIALVEELRRDLPSVQNRHDPEAEAMSESADAPAFLVALEERLEAEGASD